MANEPITREEMLLNAVATGEAANLKPITREEMFLAKLGGADVTTPVPITRKEQFLQKAIESGGSGGGGSGGGDSDEGWIGDGNTHIWITLHEGRTSPMCGVAGKGTVTVDWGDGTTPDVLMPTSYSTAEMTTNHEYASAGNYVINLTVDGELTLYGSNTTNANSYIMRHSHLTNPLNSVYSGAVKKVEMGNNAKLNNAAFHNCYNLTDIVLPNNLKQIPFSAFANCYNLAYIIIPGSVQAIDSNAFLNCYGCRYFDFTSHTAVPSLTNSNALSKIPADCEIRVPAALCDEWIAATNWATYASQIVAR